MHELRQLEVNTIELPLTSGGLLSICINLIYLKWKTRNKQHDIFHITGDVHYAILSLPAGRTSLGIHDLVFLDTHKGIRRWFLKWIYLDMPVQKALFINTISEKSKQEIITHTACEVSRISVIPNPVDRSIVFTIKTFNNEKPVLLFVGVKPNKNLENTITSISGLKVHLRIIGKPSTSQLNLLNKHQIDYTSVCSISREELAQEYQDCDMILFPSTYEGFGLPVIEGFAAGRPVITSNISPMNEISKGAALLINPYDKDSIRNAIVNLIGNETLRSALVERGFEVVKEYKPDLIAAKYRELWEKVEHGS
jgi:glycosyltransferase involved in cell wall biosynthesis